jgi:hypothetical protein
VLEVKTDLVKIDGDIMVWTQIERRDGLTFMRAKKRSRKVFFNYKA